MEGSLMKKTKGGQWHSRQFKLEGTNLIWLKSDGKTYITVDVSKNAEVRDIKFGTKKFAFEVVLSGDTISLAASGEAEKAAWMAALATAMGKRDEAEGILQKSGAGRKSVRTPLKPIGAPAKAASPATPVAAASPQTPASPASPVAAASPASPASKIEIASVVTGGLSSQAANAKLAAKIGGKIGATTQVKCVVCDQTVYKPEELIVDKAVMHKRCFQCNHCKRQLTMGNFACINSVFYCKVHYFELFSTSGGKYDKAFGDAGFKTKATTAYTPGEILQPGKLGKLAPTTTSPSAPKVASPTSTLTEVKLESPKAPSEPEKVAAAPVKALPKKLEIKAPISTKTVEKKEVEVIPKKNMDDLRKLVVLPGMAPPKPKKEEPPAPTPVTAEASAAVPQEETTAAPADGEHKPEESPSNPAEVAVESGETPGEKVEPASPVVEPAAEAEAPLIQVVRPPAGINFALEAMKIRQAQLGKAGVVVQEEPTVSEEGRASVRISGRLDHSAVLSKPKMAGRRAPKVQEVGKLLPKAEIDRMTHDFTFRVLVDGAGKTTNVLVVHATSQFERDHWVATLGANVYMLGLKHELEMAQKRDMMSALQAQINLEQFLTDNKVTYTGFLEKVSMKSQRNWKKRWFELNDKGQLMYFENENSKKPKQTLQLTYLSVIASADGSRLDAPLVISTKATEMSAETGGSLPLNIAIFDNEDVTIDLNTIVPDEFKTDEAAPETNADATTVSTMAEVTVPSATGEDFVVVPVTNASDAPSEPAAPATPSKKSSVNDVEKNEQPAADEAETADNAKVDVVLDEEEAPQRRNDAWATPGKSPDRSGISADPQPAKSPDSTSSPSSPQKFGSGSKRKGDRQKNCAVM